jgi:GR25 family glycosyltransferase involved in LPS biosynthesis
MAAERRIVVTITHAELHKHEGPWTYCVPMTDAYCKLHNIQFQHVVLKTNPEDRHFSWAKIPVLHKFVDTFDEVLFISEYATIINQSQKNIFEYIKTACVQPSAVTSVAPVMYALSDKSEQRNPLTGVFLLDCRNKAATKEFLNSWWNDIKNVACLTNYPYDQHPLLTWKNTKKADQIRIADVWSVQEYDINQVFIQFTSAYKNIQTFEAKRYMFRTLNKKQKKIGIFVRQSNYYSSGAGQNCIFIKHSLEAAGYAVDLLVDYDPSKPSIVDPQIPYIYKKANGCDYSQYGFILYGTYVPSKETRDSIRALGIRVAMFHPMNSFDGIHNDHFIHDVKTSIPLFEEEFHSFADEIWLTGNHETTYKPLLEIQNSNKIPVRIIPFTWAPLFTLYNSVSYKYNHNPSLDTINIVIFEPNISYVKNAWMPLVIAEKFYMEHKIHVNKVYLIGNFSQQANAMIDRLSLSKDSKLRKIGRMPVNEILKFFCSTDKDHNVVFISHNIQLPLNYAYYDIMNAGIPFLHNSTSLSSQSMGYMYTNIEDGVNQIETIITSYNQETYTNPIQTELALKNPYNESNVRAFEMLVETKNTELHTTIISTQNAERLQFIKKQFLDIAFPYKYTIFPAYTPETSKDYLNVSVAQAGGFSNKSQQMYQCGIRSHVDALYSCLTQSSAEYFLIVEDDVAFRRNVNIKDEINKYITLIKKHPEIHYTCLSYRPVSSKDNTLIHNSLHTLKNYRDLYWHFNASQTPYVWGAQSYIISRYYANKFVNMFKTKNVLELINAVNYYGGLYNNYTNKNPQMIIDSIMPIFLNQAIVYPMLGVERYFTNAISSSEYMNTIMQTYTKHVHIQYYPESVSSSALKSTSKHVSAYIVSTMNPQRIDFMKQQFTDIAFPFPYTFFKSFTPQTSVEFFDMDMKRGEPASLLCCMRSHIGALEFALRSSESEYFMILEDDVEFQIDTNLNEKIQAIISKLESHPDIHYISLSYLPTYLDNTVIESKLHALEHKSDDIYWGFDSMSVDFTVWGSQAYLISRKYAERLVNVFFHDKLSKIESSYKSYLSTHKKYANKTPHLTIDSIMPFILNQAILYPTLCIEKHFEDSISSTDVRAQQWDEYRKRVSCKYYIPAA